MMVKMRNYGTVGGSMVERMDCPDDVVGGRCRGGSRSSGLLVPF